MENRRWLITGATGFVGGALLGRLSGERPLRCLVRDASRLADGMDTEVVEGDLGEPADLRRALEDVDAAYFLVHSMEVGGGDFAQRDRDFAISFAETARACGVRRVVYLGGLSSAGAGSAHLDSRQEVGRLLREHGPEVVEVRASMIVGAGSDSFRTLAQLVERLPVVALPSWRDRRTQPVALDDVLGALVAAPGVAPGTYDVAGPDTLSFEDLVRAIIELRGLDRRVIPLPASSSRLEGLVASAVTDADSELLVPLMAGLHDDLLTEENALEPVFGVTPTPFRAAAAGALEELAAPA